MTSCAGPPEASACGIAYPNSDARREMTRPGKLPGSIELEDHSPETYNWIRAILRDCGWIKTRGTA